MDGLFEICKQVVGRLVAPSGAKQSLKNNYRLIIEFTFNEIIRPIQIEYIKGQYNY